MKIAFLVTRSDTIGGSHIHVRDLGITLSEDGHEVYILVGGNGPIVSYFESFGLNVISIRALKRDISPINDLRAFFQIRNSLKKLNPDIVSTHSSKAGFLGRLASKSLNIPAIFTAHGWSFTTGKSRTSIHFYKWLEKFAKPITDFFITVSDYDKKLALNNIGVSPDKIKTIHNGMLDIDPKYYSTPGKTGTVNIVMVARFDLQKNQHDLIKAVSQFDNVMLHLVGDGPLMENALKLVQEVGISNAVKFYGRVEHVHKILTSCQIFTLISNWEGFPRSTVEAMRAGLPVIVSDVGGAAEAVVHKINGFVVEKNDIESLTFYLGQLINDPELRVKMGLESRRAFEDNLKFERMYVETMDIYNKIIEK